MVFVSTQAHPQQMHECSNVHTKFDILSCALCECVCLRFIFFHFAITYCGRSPPQLLTIHSAESIRVHWKVHIRYTKSIFFVCFEFLAFIDIGYIYLFMLLNLRIIMILATKSLLQQNHKPYHIFSASQSETPDFFLQTDMK